MSDLTSDKGRLCVSASATIRDAANKIDANCLGVVFVENEGLLLGVVTDGDFRRAVLDGSVDLNDSVIRIMKLNPSTIPVGTGAEETFLAVTRGWKEGKRVLPRVDAEGRIRGFSHRDDWGVHPVSEPDLSGREAANVLECIEQNWISSSGPFIARFEEEFARYTGLRNPVAVSNGTVAITLALQALGMPVGAEVVVPAATFAATANAVVAAGGRPVFADVDSDTWGLSPRTVASLITKSTWGMIPVHLYGNPCDVKGLRELANSRGLVMIEDCAEAIGTTISGAHAGSFADAATFSFFGNKTLTTGEGGMVLFSNASSSQAARQLRDHGMSLTRKYWHDVVGFNYRLTNLQAAIGVAQVERAERLVSRKREIFHSYQQKLRSVSGVETMPASPFGQSSYWLVVVVLDEKIALERDVLMEIMASDGIQTRVAFPALHKMPAFKPYRHAPAFPISEKIQNFGLCLPSGPQMTDESVSRVVRSLDKGIQHILSS